MTAPDCAARCGTVTGLVIDVARAHGTTEQYERHARGLPGEDHAPYRCTECDYPYESALAARECADFDLSDDRGVSQ